MDESNKPKGFKFDYVCDACSLGITVNNNNMMLLNHDGDGDGTVFVYGFDDGDPIELPDYNQTDLVLVVGKNAGEDTPIALGLRHSAISTSFADVYIVASQFHIFKVRNSRDFVIRVSEPKCVKSLVVSGQGHLEFKGFDKVGD